MGENLRLNVESVIVEVWIFRLFEASLPEKLLLPIRLFVAFSASASVIVIPVDVRNLSLSAIMLPHSAMAQYPEYTAKDVVNAGTDVADKEVKSIWDQIVEFFENIGKWFRELFGIEE